MLAQLAALTASRGSRWAVIGLWLALAASMAPLQGPLQREAADESDTFQVRGSESLAAKQLAHDKPPELMATSLTRAFFCESLGRISGIEQQLDLFMTGLISGLPAMLDVPLIKLLDELSIGTDIREALKGGETPMGKVYALALAHESGAFTQMTETAGNLRIQLNDLTKTYFEATNRTVLDVQPLTAPAAEGGAQ